MSRADAVSLLTLLLAVAVMIGSGIFLGVGIWFGDPLSFEVMR